jgi:hypothetical protein
MSTADKGEKRQHDGGNGWRNERRGRTGQLGGTTSSEEKEEEEEEEEEEEKKDDDDDDDEEEIGKRERERLAG